MKFRLDIFSDKNIQSESGRLQKRLENFVIAWKIPKRERMIFHNARKNYSFYAKFIRQLFFFLCRLLPVTCAEMFLQKLVRDCTPEHENLTSSVTSSEKINEPSKDQDGVTLHQQLTRRISSSERKPWGIFSYSPAVVVLTEESRHFLCENNVGKMIDPTNSPSILVSRFE